MINIPKEAKQKLQKQKKLNLWRIMKGWKSISSPNKKAYIDITAARFLDKYGILTNMNEVIF